MNFLPTTDRPGSKSFNENSSGINEVGVNGSSNSDACDNFGSRGGLRGVVVDLAISLRLELSLSRRKAKEESEEE